MFLSTVHNVCFKPLFILERGFPFLRSTICHVLSGIRLERWNGSACRWSREFDISLHNFQDFAPEKHQKPFKCVRFTIQLLAFVEGFCVVLVTSRTHKL